MYLNLYMHSGGNACAVEWTSVKCSLKLLKTGFTLAQNSIVTFTELTHSSCLNFTLLEPKVYAMGCCALSSILFEKKSAFCQKSDLGLAVEARQSENRKMSATNHPIHMGGAKDGIATYDWDKI